ncbi:Lysine-specific histone demethylase 1 3 [Lecanosticta acicola]|uniref:Lysine-specific histone demethylase 1 3 n=1 Tax=Lecanosticta acicola TaxID=111012 RepID=A0AAI8YZC1_9PEZI|nr:Lysine-specific histone demethylase 1 3 [Lecanosticta acicola]
MAASVADTGYITSQAKLPAAALGQTVNVNVPQPPTVDEDDSSLSSSGTEVFDRSDPTPSQRNGWQLDANGTWRRYGSSDSAPSTGISSMSSSVAADDPITEKPLIPPPSRKRWFDGSVKTFPPTASQPIQTTTTLPPAPDIQQVPDRQAPPRKKCGRPPKIRPPVTETPSTHNAPATISPKEPRAPRVTKNQIKARPRSSIPSRLSAETFASQCIQAAYDSRLDPYALHPSEDKLLVNSLTSKEVTVYLNIRNAILRVWTQNPLCSVSIEEALGCAKASRYFGLAEVAYKWLGRNGYINFGCVHVPKDPSLPKRLNKDAKQRTVVVIGAGVSGLTTARQLESHFRQEAAKWINAGELPPRVIVLEGRKRIGGRVYSKPLRSQVKNSLPDGLRNTAEMGAMIVTGFEHGNPLDTIIRGQLGIRYHLMKDALTIYDCDGKAIEEKRDMLNTELYTDISDRAGEYRAEPQKQDTLHGDEDLINRCRDPVPDGFTAFQLEPLPAAHVKVHKPAARRGRRRNAPPGTEKLTGRSEVMEEGTNSTVSASRAAKNMGWQIKDGIARNRSITLHGIAGASAYPTLGTVMDEAIQQYQDLIDMTPLDMRLLNWHHANLEYANAAPVSQLSLSGHDQDTGNEFEGAHSEIVGGYTQVPRGLMNIPTKLDVRFNRIVDSIHYDDRKGGNGPVATKIVCTDGEVIEADEVVMTAPLGVLKSGDIDFDPPLPSWKSGAIDRMGFGLLNKVILLYDEPFWDDERDMFGLLNEAERNASMDPTDYERRRGRFYLFWNCSKISGRPMLIALMAGNAAHDAEWTDTATLMAEVTTRLRSVFTKTRVPNPREVIVTRWRRDPFTRGTYSYVAPETRPGDYDLMAKPVGNLHFAGEATCGTHPATVHGAFLSGLRVASDVMDSMAGAIELPTPLVGALQMKQEALGSQVMVPQMPVLQTMPHSAEVAITGSYNLPSAPNANVPPSGPMIKMEESSMQLTSIPAVAPTLATSTVPKKPAALPARSVCATDPSFWVAPSFEASDLDYEAAVISSILSQIGDRPTKPTRPGVNPFLLFTKDKWEDCKLQTSSNGRDVIRRTLGEWWRRATDEEKQPYIVQSQAAQEFADSQRKDWEVNVAQWDQDAARIRQEYMQDHPPPQLASRSAGAGNGLSKRKTNVSNNVVLDHF